jgi:hypothetical protein
LQLRRFIAAAIIRATAHYLFFRAALSSLHRTIARGIDGTITKLSRSITKA